MYIWAEPRGCALIWRMYNAAKEERLSVLLRREASLLWETLMRDGLYAERNVHVCVRLKYSMKGVVYA